VRLIAAIDLHPAISLPLAAGATIAVLWYWSRLGTAAMPESRRRIRRYSLLVVLLLIPGLVAAASFIDHHDDPAAYLGSWLVVLALLALLVLVAMVDVLDTLRLRRVEMRRIRRGLAVRERDGRDCGGRSP